MRGEKEPLWRKVNTRTHGVRHGGGEARWERGTKAAAGDGRMRGTMHAGARQGRDYTPLFRFLLSRVGQPWDATHAEAVARLDGEEPVWWMVTRREEDRTGAVRMGESSYWSGLFVDGAGVLQVVDPAISHETMEPSCGCCTHTFNGKRLVRSWRG